MKITNQKPVELSPVYKSSAAGSFDPVSYLKETVVTPLFNPLIQGSPVTITGQNQNVIDEDQITNRLLSCMGDVTNIPAEQFCKTLYRKTLVSFDENTPLSIQNLFAIQAAVKSNLPYPSSTCIYTPAIDVIPACKKFLAGKIDEDEFFATMAFYTRSCTLGFYFANDIAFDNFKTWLNNQLPAITAFTTNDTNQMLADFQKLTLSGLTESIIIRNNDDENNEAYSFARLITSFLMAYKTQTSISEFGVMPFDLGELFCPKTIVFVNVDVHSKASAKQIADEWDIIAKSLANKPKIISNKKLNSLTGMQRNLKKIQSIAINTTQTGPVLRSARIKFRKTAPTSKDLTKWVKKISGKMGNVMRSDNVYKTETTTFNKANRRDPDDYNKPGKTHSTKYRPDIHLYIDTSGSISEENYQDAVKACIVMARKMNVNLYFNSFSHVLSQCSKLNTKDKSVGAVYAEFQKIPKVDGGTNYEQIWHYINESAKRKRELSIIMTDFEYHAPNHYVKHPKNLYYAPISHTDWDSILYYAKSFCESMKNIDPDCRAHLLL